MVNPEFHTILADRSEQHVDEKKWRLRPVSFVVAGMLLLVFVLIGASLYRTTLPPLDFVPDTLISVPSGYSLADIALYAYTHVAGEGGFDLGAFPAVQAWVERIAARPAVVRGLQAIA